MGKALSGSLGLNSCPSPSLALPCQRRTQNRVSWRAVNLDGRADPNCLRRSRLCVLRLKNNISPSASCNFPDLMGEDARPRERRWCRRSLASCLTHGALPPNCSKLYMCQPKRHPAPCEGLLASTRAVPCPGAGAGASEGVSPITALAPLGISAGRQQSWCGLYWQKFCDPGKMYLPQSAFHKKLGLVGQ